MSKNTNIADLINYISVDGSGNVVLSTGQLVATQNYVTTAVSNLVASAPSTLDTLNELATALGNDANFATTVATSIGTKLNLSGGTLTGALNGTSASFSSTLAAMGSNIQFNLDGTFGTNYYTIGFGGVSNGFNRIAGGTGTTDGLYITSATGRDIAFRTNGSGTTSMLITSGGNVGIGTSSPITIFDTRLATTDSVAGSVLSSYPIASFINNASGGGQRGLQIGAPTGGIVSPIFLKVFGTSQRLSFVDNNNRENLTILEGGNVGFGTISPGTLLHINTSARTSGTNVNILTLSDTVTGIQTSGYGVRIVGTSNNGSAISAISFDADGGTNNDTSISFHTQSTAGALTERMKITRLGNVGIGFNNATSKLQVAGEITTYAGTNTQFYAYMNYLGTTYNFGPGEATDNVDFKIAGGGTFTTGGGFRFFTQPGSTTPVERMRITSGGLLQLINSTGIRFASGASNLNYYQEGSWTPQLIAGSTSFTMSGINDGRYVRVGNQVTISGHLQWSGGSGTGMVRITGLPFACTGVRSAGSMGAVGSGISFNSGYNHWILVIDPGADFIYVIQGDSTGGGYSHNPPVASSGVIYGFSITYHTL
jgi:hypothetical protein